MKKDSRLKRVPIQMAKVLTSCEYKLLDYLLYRSNLDNWLFWINDLETQTGLSNKTIIKGLKNFVMHQWVYQEKGHYHFDRMKCEKDIWKQLDKMEKPTSPKCKVTPPPSVKLHLAKCKVTPI